MSSLASLKFSTKRLLFLFLVGLVARLGMDIANSWYLFTFNNEPQKVAEQLLSGNGFSNPFLLPTGPTAHLAPGFPALLAVIYAIFGNGIAGSLAADTVNAAIGAAVASLLPVAVLLCGAGPIAALFAGLFYAMLPPQPYTESKGGWEAVIGALLLVSAFNAVQQQIASSRLDMRKAAWIGFLLGLAGLFLPTLCPVIAGFVLVLSLYKRERIAQFGLVVFLIAFTLLGPWLVRNRMVFGQWVPIRDNFGIELHVSYWDKAAPTLTENIHLGNHAEVHPHVNRVEALKVREYGEAEYNRRQFELARAWIQRHPRRFVQLTLKHFQLFWTSGIRFILLIPFALVGMARLWTTAKPPFLLLSVAFILQPLIYYFVQFEPRYRHPIEWAVTLAAVIGAFAIYQRARDLLLGP